MFLALNTIRNATQTLRNKTNMVARNRKIDLPFSPNFNPKKHLQIKIKSMELQGSSKPMIATQQEMVESKVPLAYRDQCAHLLIPLNKCRQSEFYLPWKCENERHTYEKCAYELVMERMLQMKKIKQSKQEQQGNPISLIPKTANA